MKCVICNTDGHSPTIEPALPDTTTFCCPRCGRYRLWHSLAPTIVELSTHQRSVLSHRIRRMQKDSQQAVWLVTDEIDQFRLDEQLPDIREALDNLILWIGNAQGDVIGRRVHLDLNSSSAWIGLSLEETPEKFFGWLLQDPEVGGLVAHDASLSGVSVEPEILVASVWLTISGWARFEMLRRQQVDSRLAFMALQFGDAELDNLVETHFKLAVERTGFELRILTDRQPAGLIDDQLRVALRRSKFVIADLTHANNGAYWEAGFAEGLGRPVIYTCRKMEWETKGRKTHFDTNHLVTVIWDPKKPDEAARRLATTIRATLPDEAVLQDDCS